MDPARGEDTATSGAGSRAEELSARREQAWLADRLSRERPTALAASALGASLIMAWGVLDYFLERRWFEVFVSLRLGAAALIIPMGAAIWRGGSLALIRAAMVAAVAIMGVAVAIMLPRLDYGFALYLLGFSLLFWGPGVLLSWPVWCAALAYCLVVAAYAGAHLTYQGPRTAAEIWGGLFYVMSAAVISLTLTALKIRLERRNLELAFSLGERNQELARALKELAAAQAALVQSEKQSALGRLLAGLSHELNNPVNIIANNLEPVRGYVDVLARVVERCEALRDSTPRLDTELSDIAPRDELAFVVSDVRAAIDAIESGSERMRQVHGDLRAFIRGDAARPERGDVTRGLRATVDMLRRNLRSEVSIEAHYGELPPVRHEPGPLNQVFFNLIQNAIDAVGERGRVEVTSRTADGAIEVVVSDSGPGLSERALAHLFEPFFTTKPARKGTGLGLAISKQIVERQGGQLELADPRTATFIVRLPIAGAD